MPSSLVLNERIDWWYDRFPAYFAQWEVVFNLFFRLWLSVVAILTVTPRFSYNGSYRSQGLCMKLECQGLYMKLEYSVLSSAPPTCYALMFTFVALAWMDGPFLLLCGALLNHESVALLTAVALALWVSCRKNEGQRKRTCALLASYNLIHEMLFTRRPHDRSAYVSFWVPSANSLFPKSFAWSVQDHEGLTDTPLGILLPSVIPSSWQFMSTGNISPKPCPKTSE